MVGRWSWRSLRSRVLGRLRTPKAVTSSPVVVLTTLAGPSAVAAENAHRVSAAAESAGVWCGLIRNQSRNRLRVAVDEADREALRAALIAQDPDVEVRAIARSRSAVAGCLAELDPDALAEAHIWRVFRRYRVPGSDSLRYGVLQGCDVEFWERQGDDWVAPSRNEVAQVLPLELLEYGETEIEGHRLPTVVPLWIDDRLGDARFPIDVVYTWVDGDDPAWRQRYREHRAAAEGVHEEAVAEARFGGVDHLRYSLRSLWMHAPWVNHVWLVTDRQVPDWLDRDHPGITVVDHRDIFADPSVLPTFNSHAIESQLHHIDGLSETFLYFNDDVFLGRVVGRELFVEGNGILRIFPSVDHIDLGPIREDERPFMAAAKRVRELVHERFGVRVTQKLKHTPHVLSRALLAELESRHADLVARTAASRFRHGDDLSLAAALHPWVAYLERRAVRAELAYEYLDTSEADLEERLARIASKRDLDVFCINDTTADADALARIDAIVGEFLQDYFPLPSTWERDGGRRRSDGASPRP